MLAGNPRERSSLERATFGRRPTFGQLGFVARDPQLTLVDTVAYLRQGVDAD